VRQIRRAGGVGLQGRGAERRARERSDAECGHPGPGSAQRSV